MNGHALRRHADSGATDDDATAGPDVPRPAPLRHALSRRRLLAVGAGAGAALTLAASPRAARAAATCESRYFGYRAGDLARPYAKYMKPHVDAPQQQVLDAIAAGPTPTAQVPARRTLAAEIERTDYAPIETGYGKTAAGEIWVACLTHMPRVEPRMWDWWFGWHSKESARYKLWHPDAHAYAALKNDTADKPGLTDRQRFVNNTSYVDEVIGGHLDQLAIGFRDPGAFGIDVSKIDGTVIAGTVGTALAPVNIGMVVHEVRRVPGGSEMRSRFYLNVAGVRAFDAAAFACAVSRGISPPRSITFDVPFGGALLRHCGEEMNHLAQFLPELYAEFSGHA